VVTRSEPESNSRRSSLVTILAIAVTAYALCDLVHEVLGHGIAALMVPGVRVLSLSTVALQTTGTSRVVAAAGSIANILVGAVALALFHRTTRFSSTAYFCWLFGSLNVLNGSGYPLYSAVLGFGDWEAVTRGLQPTWLWRMTLGIVGAGAYAGAVVLAALELTRSVRRGLVSRSEVPRLVFPSYVAGGVLLIVSAVFNPISPSLIFLSGVSSGFAAMAGLTIVPSIVEKRTVGISDGSGLIAQSPGWVLGGLVIGTVFIAVFGPGVLF
jgi:hypothetical protein